MTPPFGWANSSDGCSAYPGHSVHPDSRIPPASDRRMTRSERKPTRPRVGASDDIVLPSAALAWLQSHILYCRVWYDTASKSGETWSWMGVSVSKKRACPALATAPRDRNGGGTDGPARWPPERTRRWNHRVVAETKRGCCERIPRQRPSTPDPLEGPNQDPQTGVPTATWESCLRMRQHRVAHRVRNPTVSAVGGGRTQTLPLDARYCPAFTRRRRSKRDDLVDAHVAESRVEIRETPDGHSIDGPVRFV